MPPASNSLGANQASAPAKRPRQRCSRSASKKPAKPKKAVAVKKPVVCSKAFVVMGGFLKAGHIVPTVEFEGEHFVKATLSENWLCKAASGKCRSLAPLARTHVVTDLRGLQDSCSRDQAFDDSHAPAGTSGAGHGGTSKASSGSAAGMKGLGLQDMMDDFGLDDGMSSSCLHTSSKSSAQPNVSTGSGSADNPVARRGMSHLLLGQKARKLAARKCNAQGTPKVLDVKLPLHWQQDGRTSVRLLSRPVRGPALRTGVYLTTDAVSWLVGQVCLEVTSGRVAFQPEESAF